MHRFYIDSNDIKGSIAVITGQEAKHLVNVLRLLPGMSIELADGSGTHYLAMIQEISSGKAVCEITGRTFMQGESPAHIAVAQAMLKDKKMDVILRHLTELGITEWIPFFSSRSIPLPDRIKVRNMEIRIERWAKIARESVKQCGRSLIPAIHEPVSFHELVGKASLYDEKIAFWEKESSPFDSIRDARSVSDAKKIIVMIGPEGGFSDQEIETAKSVGFRSFSLGKRILRAETAAIAACALVQNIFGDLGTHCTGN